MPADNGHRTEPHGCSPEEKSRPKAALQFSILLTMGVLDRGLSVPERNGASHRSRARPDGVAVIAALHDPLTILLADDPADVVTPDDDGPD
jgi:hypothetical protein